MGTFSQFSVARELLQRGELEQALAEVDRVIGLFGKSAEALELEGEIRGAIVDLRQTPEEKAEIWFSWGNEKLFTGSFVDAITDYEQAIHYKPDFHKAWNERGMCLKKLNRYEEAIHSYDQAISLKPDFHEAWFNRGVSSGALGCNEDEMFSYEQAISYKPDFHEAWVVRGYSLANVERHEEAIIAYEQALRFEPDYDEAWISHGKPSFHKAWLAHATSLYALGRYGEAVDAYEQALIYEPDNADVSIWRGAALHAAERYEEAVDAYEQALAHKPDNPTTWAARGNLLQYLQRYEEALKCYEQVLVHEPENAEAWYWRGAALSGLGRYEEAVDAYEQALAHKPDNPTTWAARGNSLYHLQHYEEAIKSYDQAIKLKTDDHESWYWRGLALREFGLYEDALRSYDKAINIKQDSYAYWTSRASIICDIHQTSVLRSDLAANIRGHSIVALHQSDPHIAALDEALPHLAINIEALGKIYQDIGDTYWKHRKFQGNKSKSYLNKAMEAYDQSLRVFTEVSKPEERLQTLQKLIRTHDALRKIAPDAMQALLRQGTELRTRILTQARSDEQRERLTRTLPNFNELTVDFHLSQGDNITALETAEADKNGLMQWLLPVPGTANYAEMRETISVDTAIVYWYLGADAIATFVIRADHEGPIVVTEFDREISLKMRDRLDEWIKAWNKNYTNHNAKSKDSDIENDNTWRNTLSAQLADLAEILDIAKLLPHLQNIQNLILVPHRDLHRFPLHTFFPQAKITYLPSLHLGRHLRSAQRLAQTQLLSIEAPAHNGAKPLYHAGIESIALRYLHPNHLYLAPQQSDQPTFLQAIAQPHTHLHFNGHANHNPDNPKHSELMLQGNDTLTLNTFRQSPYHPSQIVTLAACETGITNAQTITAEYVGWVSAFLSHDVPYVLSTLWTVHSEATALFMMQFYRQHHHHQSPVIAHHQAQQWLRHLTVRKLARLYQAAIPHQTGEVFEFLEIELLKLGKMEKSDRPYADPYYWAAFILSGRPNSL